MTRIAWRAAFAAAAVGLLGRRHAAAEIVAEARPSWRQRPSSGRSRAAPSCRRGRASAAPSATSPSARAARSRKAQVIAVVVDDKLALQRDAAEAQVKALRSQLDNAHDRPAARRAAVQERHCTAKPRRCRPHAGRGLYQPARRRRGRTAPSSSSNRARARCSRPLPAAC